MEAKILPSPHLLSASLPSASYSHRQPHALFHRPAFGLQASSDSPYRSAKKRAANSIEMEREEMNRQRREKIMRLKQHGHKSAIPSATAGHPGANGMPIQRRVRVPPQRQRHAFVPTFGRWDSSKDGEWVATLHSMEAFLALLPLPVPVHLLPTELQRHLRKQAKTPRRATKTKQPHCC